MILIYTLLTLYIFWLFFLAIMSLYRAYRQKTITKTAFFLGYPILIIGAVVDFALNITIFSLIFLQRPCHLLLTQRMQDYIKTDMGWRGKLSKWMCDNLLNAFDVEGKHC